MIVIRTAITASLNASSRPLVTAASLTMRAGLVVEVVGRRVRRERSRQLREVLRRGPDVGDQEVGEVAVEAVAHDDPERGEVLAVLREGVRGDEPALLAQDARD